jgi:site-specific recombinase XerC
VVGIGTVPTAAMAALMESDALAPVEYLHHARGQTGLRLSELVSLDRAATHLGAGAHVQCVGKGRGERCTPLTSYARAALQAWGKEPTRRGASALFPNV